MRIDIEENLIDNSSRNSNVIDKEMESFLFSEEGKNIKSDIDLLNSMGFDKKMINKVYAILRPENIERAVDYMSEIDGIYQHKYIESSNINECFICKKPRKNHLDYIPDDILNEALNNNINNNINNNLINNNNYLIDINKDINHGEEKNNNSGNDLNFDECQVCYGEISKDDKELNSLPCGHLFCTYCWFNYLKTLITEAKVDTIKCMDHECDQIISEEFIFAHLKENQNLVEKYNKFKKRTEIIKDKNKKLCPNPDCDSFLKKSKNSKYVECENGHKFCFDCLNPPHGNKPCDQKLEKQFMKWKKGKRVKRCPRCQIYTEKNEGCNHMTCVNCKYQWCWLCEGQYNYDHYKSGSCKGQQFTRADNVKEALSFKNSFGLHKIFKCVYMEINAPFDFNDFVSLKYLMIFLFWIFGFAFLFGFINVLYLGKKINFKKERNEGIVAIFLILIGLCIFVSFEILFTWTITPFILISFIYHRFFERLLLFYGIGKK